MNDCGATRLRGDGAGAPAQRKGARFITFEGGEGSGKTTQLALVAKQLRQAGCQVVETREPGGSSGGEAIRQLLLQGETGRWDAMSELLLLYAARRDHCRRIIQPALARGDWVLCDRFADSSMAYQGYGHQLGREAIDKAHSLALGGFHPDLTFVLDLPVSLGLARTRRRAGQDTRFEALDAAFHERVRSGFLDIARRQPGRVVVIAADNAVEEVFKSLWQVVQKAASGPPR